MGKVGTNFKNVVNIRSVSVSFVVAEYSLLLVVLFLYLEISVVENVDLL